MKKRNENLKNGFTFLLSILLLISLMYSLKKTQEYSKLQTNFSEEKKELELELEELIEDYKDLSVKKKDLSKRLIREMNKIIALKDSVKNIKDSNYKSIRKYRRKITTLERENRDLFAKVDSLNIINSYLKQQNKEVITELKNKNELTKELQETNKKLAETKKILSKKVSIAGELKATSLKVNVMKERISGKLTTTSRSSRADAFKTSFKIPQNKITTAGEKNIYIQITDDKNNVIAPKGTVELANKTHIEYSDKLVADYQNEELSVLSLVLVNRDNISRGEYTISVFLDKKIAAKSKVRLR